MNKMLNSNEENKKRGGKKNNGGWIELVFAEIWWVDWRLWWVMVMIFLKLVIIAAMMMVVNDCWCHMVKYSISTTMIVVFTLIPGIEDKTTRHCHKQSLSKWQLVLCLEKKFSSDWWFIVRNIYEIAVSLNFYSANFVPLGLYSTYTIMKAFWDL